MGININSTEIGLVRHGLTDYNIGKCQSPYSKKNHCCLNDEGRFQIQKQVITLRNRGWEFIITSDLLRARETAMIIEKKLNIPVYFWPGLRERECGPIKHNEIDEVESYYPQLLFSSKFFGEEPIELFNTRVRKTFETLVETYYGHKFLVISHEGTLKTFYNIFFYQTKDIWKSGEKVDVVYNNQTWVLKDSYLL